MTEKSEKRKAISIKQMIAQLDEQANTLTRKLAEDSDEFILLALQDAGLAPGDLTPTQLRVLPWLGTGLRAKEIAKRVDVSERSVRRTLHDERLAPIIEALKARMLARTWSWAASLLPLSLYALYENLTTGNLDQKRLAAKVVLQALQAWSKWEPMVREEKDIYTTPRVAPGTWDLVREPD